MDRGTVVVTGGTGGLGAPVTAAFREAGWRRVVVPWIDESELARMPDTAGMELVRADLFDPAGVAAVMDVATADPSARLCAVVNLVGGFAAGGRVHETPVADFERMLTLNLRPTYLVTQAALPHLVSAGGGCVVCVGARAALEPFPGAVGYITAKAAVMAFARAVAVEYRDRGVRCNCVLPSIIDTPGNRAAQPDADHSRWVDPAEIAQVVHFLCTDGSGPVSGATIPVYGRA